MLRDEEMDFGGGGVELGASGFSRGWKGEGVWRNGDAKNDYAGGGEEGGQGGDRGCVDGAGQVWRSQRLSPLKLQARCSSPQELTILRT